MQQVKYGFGSLMGLLFFLWINGTAFSQAIFSESFNEANNAMFGTDNIGGVTWSSYCPTCLSGDIFNVQNGELVGNDTNGEAGWETGTIMIDACQSVEITFTVKENGTMEGCGTGCNAVDWVSLEYSIDGNPYQAAPNSFFCAGACANTSVIYADDLTNGIASYSSGCLGSGSTLQFRIKVQTWAQDEFWIIDDIAVNCVGSAVTLDPVPTVCESDAPFQLTNSGGGGFWSGPGVNSSGIFDPSIAGPGSHPITFSYGAGSCAAQTSMSIIVTAAPTIGIVSTPNTTICGSGIANLNLSNATGTIQWQSATTPSGIFSDITSANALSFSTGVLSGPMCYRAVVSGCGAPLISNVVCISVDPIPIVSAGPDQSICTGQSTIVAGAGASTYSWTGGIIDGQAFGPITNSATYTVTGTSAAGCTNTDQLTIQVNALPIVNAGPDQVICSNSSVVLSASGANTYSWTNGVINDQSFTPSSSATYTVTGTDLNGCTNSDNVLVTINSNPVLPPIPSVAVACLSNLPSPDEAAVAAIMGSVVANPIVQFISDVSDGNTCNQEEIVRTYNISDACGGSQNVTQIITISAITPSVNAGLDQVVCEELAVTLNAISSQPGSTISWDQGVQQGVAFIPSSIGSTTYTVSNEICGGTCVSTDQVEVVVETATTPSFSADTLLICQGSSIVFESTTTNSVACLWDFGNGQQSTSCDGEVITYNSSGLFDVSLSVTNAAGCTSTAVYSNFIEVLASPNASFITSTQTIGEMNNEVIFNNTSTNATNVHWDFGDNSSSIEETPIHLFNVATGQNYLVELIVSNDLGCSDSTSILIVYEEELIYFVPNSFTPDDDEHNPVFLPILNDVVDSYNYQLLIFNRWGSVVFESKSIGDGWDGTFDGKPVQDGVYIWKLVFKMKNNDDVHEAVGHVTVLR